MYLEELGYMTFDHKGNSIGFKYFVSEGENSVSDKKNISSGSQTNAQDSTEFQINNDQTNSEFLSENYSFSKLLEKNNIIFIGPPANAVKQMGDKISSKKIALKAKVNCIPGLNKEIKDYEQAFRVSNDIGNTFTNSA